MESKHSQNCSKTPFECSLLPTSSASIDWQTSNRISLMKLISDLPHPYFEVFEFVGSNSSRDYLFTTMANTVSILSAIETFHGSFREIGSRGCRGGSGGHARVVAITSLSDEIDTRNRILYIRILRGNVYFWDGRAIAVRITVNFELAS
jgi:hypothetical protein